MNRFLLSELSRQPQFNGINTIDGTFAFVDRTNDAARFDIRDADHLFAIGIAYARKRCFPVGTTTHIDYE